MSCKCFDQKPSCKPTDEFLVRLEASKCNCTSRFTVQERKSKFIVISHDTSVIDKYKIDGYLDTDATHDKCDYLFRDHPANPQKNTCLFVELKGIDIEHAVKQIGDTIDRSPVTAISMTSRISISLVPSSQLAFLPTMPPTAAVSWRLPSVSLDITSASRTKNMKCATFPRQADA